MNIGRRALGFGLLTAALVLATACGRYGPARRAPEYRDGGSKTTEATSTIGRGSEPADEAGEEEE